MTLIRMRNFFIRVCPIRTRKRESLLFFLFGEFSLFLISYQGYPWQDGGFANRYMSALGCDNLVSGRLFAKIPAFLFSYGAGCSVASIKRARALLRP